MDLVGLSRARMSELEAAVIRRDFAGFVRRPDAGFLLLLSSRALLLHRIRYYSTLSSQWIARIFYFTGSRRGTSVPFET